MKKYKYFLAHRIFTFWYKELGDVNAFSQGLNLLLMFLMRTWFVWRIGLGGSKVKVTVLSEKFLQLESVLDLLPEYLKNSGTGGGACPHIASSQGSGSSLPRFLILESNWRQTRGWRITVGLEEGTEHAAWFLKIINFNYQREERHSIVMNLSEHPVTVQYVSLIKL